jgi:hypothetical protein
MIKKKWISFSFISIDTPKSHPEISFDFISNHVEIVTLINQGVLPCHTHNKPCYYVCNLTTKQWQKMPSPKIWYDTMEFDMMVERSKPLHYKIVRFSRPKFRSHDKKFYLYHCIRVELFDLKTWRWKLLDEVKLPQEESLYCMTKVFINCSLHWLTWKRNIFVFDVKRESYCLFLLPPPVYERNDNKDIVLAE